MLSSEAVKEGNERAGAFFDNWSSKPIEKMTQPRQATQRNRFEIVLRHLSIKNGDSILDVGGAHGDFLQFLLDYDIVPGSYVCVDMSRKLQAVGRERFASAERKLGIDISWVFGDGLTDRKCLEQLGKFDYAVCTSVFSVRTHPLSMVKPLFEDAIDGLFQACKKMACISAHTIYLQNPSVEDTLLDPCFMFQTGKRLTERVLVDHSYMPHDALLILWKEPSEFRQDWDREGGW